MTFTLTTAIREIVRASHTMQPYEGHHLSIEGFKMEGGLWIRRTYLEPREFDLVFMVPRRDLVIKESDCKSMRKC